MARNGVGKLITIDPFGKERVPDLMKTWPPQAQAVTEFKPAFSMEYFASLETSAARGQATPLGVVFVDL